ncbi:uncharacterized protein EAE98_009317 [Botrytis deweyae]|uniref:Uncharacterized protein n=1 Tax=Botrytis deweyae TaxID=2478750 RepID=A0ABQ7IBY0_9HELO|nr:uncharacterized protein EAE98_009317 [Botrytis deweyae]KAF7919477.1 hypothetical protein EAE98_009317 [Botrytis deweyae]
MRSYQFWFGNKVPVWYGNIFYWRETSKRGEEEKRRKGKGEGEGGEEEGDGEGEGQEEEEEGRDNFNNE